MTAAAHKPLNLAAVAAVALACLPVLFVPTWAVPWVLAGLGLLGVGLIVVHGGDMLKLLLAWLAIASVFTLFFHSWDIPGFFNLTVDRIAFVAIVFLFMVAVLLGRVRLVWPSALGMLIVALVGWTAISAHVSGWTLTPEQLAQNISPPYYRFFVGFLFPAAVFFMAASLVRSDRQIHSVLLFFTLFGVYLTFTGIAEQFGWDALVWPKYILSDIGIHRERVRGPFLNAPDMGFTLVICLFANLLLATRVRTGWALLILAVTLPMPLVIFWTLTRSIWLAAVACGFVAICTWPRPSPLRWAAGLLAAAALLLVVFGMWGRLSSAQREVGGVADIAPILNRTELAKVSVELAGSNPLIGVGIGRFQLAAPQSEAFRQVASPAAIYGHGAVEHNNFLSMLAETGIPGALLYAAMVFGLLVVSVRLYRMIPATAPGPLDRRFVTFFWIVWLAFFVDSMFRLTTSSPFPNSVFLLTGGLIVGYYRQLLPQPVRPPAFSVRPGPTR